NAQLLSLLLGGLALGVGGACVLQEALQIRLGAGGVVEEVRLEDGEVPERVAAGARTARRLVDDELELLLRGRVLLEAAPRDAERDVGGPVLGRLLQDRLELLLGARVVAGV